MPDNITNAAALAADLIPLVIKDELLMIAEKDCVFYDLADKVKLPEGEGRTVQWTRFERLALPMQQLSEGIPPDGVKLASSAVQATVDQWGDVVIMTDVGMVTAKHPVLRIAQDRLGTQFAELIDRELQKVLNGGTNVFFPNAKTSRSALAPGDNIIGDTLRQIVANMKSAGAPKYEKNAYMGVVDPFVSMDVQKDSLFTQAAQYQDIVALRNAELGMWLGIRFKESNLIPVFSRMANVNGGANDVLVADVAVAGGELGYAANSHVSVVVTHADPVTGFENSISAVQDVTNAGVFAASVTLAAGAPDGVYGIYVSLEGAGIGLATATLQRYVNHRQGLADVVVFFKAGAASGASRYVTQAMGPVAPTTPPAVGNVHVSYILGRQAFGCTELGKMQTYLTPNAPDTANPLVQIRKVGWKHYFKGVVKDSRFFVRVESTSLFS